MSSLKMQVLVGVPLAFAGCVILKWGADRKSLFENQHEQKVQANEAMKVDRKVEVSVNALFLHAILIFESECD